MGAGEGVENYEYLIKRVECFYPALNVINCYSEQRKTRKEEVEGKWERLRQEMEGIRARQEFCILLGDLNKLVDIGEWGMPGKQAGDFPGWSSSERVAGYGKLGQARTGYSSRKDPATGVESCLNLL